MEHFLSPSCLQYTLKNELIEVCNGTLSITIEDFSDYEAITSIIKITNGNFRLIQRLFSQIERILKINNLTIITTEVVEAARDSLVIGIK